MTDPDRALWRPRAAEEVEQEFAFHVEVRMREYIAQGMEPKEARRRVIRRCTAPPGNGRADRARRAAGCARPFYTAQRRSEHDCGNRCRHPGSDCRERLLQGLLYDTSAHDATTYAAVIVLVLVATVVASWIPARRAALADPLDAMRAD